MGPSFWLRRFATVYALAFLVIGASQWLLRGRDPADAALHAAVWAGAAAIVYTGTAFHRTRRCALRQGAPDPR